VEPSSIDFLLGSTNEAHVRIEVLGYEHPEVVEPQGLDLLECRVYASASPVQGEFIFSLRVAELIELRSYLAQIHSGNGPPASLALAHGLLNLSFAPSRRGPVLCAVMLKSIDVSHVRLEFMVTLEPQDIGRALGELSQLGAA
jgi:hypothetical protein